jgi:hypothetical protein
VCCVSFDRLASAKRQIPRIILSYMLPTIRQEYLHLIHQAHRPRLNMFILPLLSRLVLPLLKPGRYPPISESPRQPLTPPYPSIGPNPLQLHSPSRPGPTSLWIHNRIRYIIIRHSHIRIQPNPFTSTQLIIHMYQTALRSFNMFGCKGIGDSSEGQRWIVVERLSVEDGEAVPA